MNSGTIPPVSFAGGIVPEFIQAEKRPHHSVLYALYVILRAITVQPRRPLTSACPRSPSILLPLRTQEASHERGRESQRGGTIHAFAVIGHSTHYGRPPAGPCAIC